MGKVVVVGSSNTDMVVTAAKLPRPGETVMGNTFSVFPGGKGANQAVAASRAGATTTFVTQVGNDDFGAAAIAGYEKDNIDTRYISKHPTAPSGVAMILVDDQTGENCIVVASGANGHLSADNIKRAAHEIQDSNALLVQLEVPLDIVVTALEIAKSSNVRTILNPAPIVPLENEVLRLVDIITPNETETELLVSLPVQDDQSIQKAAKQLVKSVNEMAIITLGARGVYFLHRNGQSGFISAPTINAVDTTAAGDVFNGYLAAALADDISIEDAIHRAVQAASLSVTTPGAQTSIPHLPDLP